MTVRTCVRLCIAMALSLGASGWSRTAEAGLVLSFDQSSYSAALGGTTTVQVFASQVAGGPQVGPNNGLISGDIALTFATGGSATVLSTAAVTFGPAWSIGLASSGPSGPNTIFNMSLLSLSGITNLASPLLLASLQFTGVSAGLATISVAQFDPNSPDFITIGGDIIDPTNVATASITVGTAAVPEPGSLALLSMAALVGGAVRPLRRALVPSRSA